MPSHASAVIRIRKLSPDADGPSGPSSKTTMPSCSRNRRRSPARGSLVFTGTENDAEYREHTEPSSASRTAPRSPPRSAPGMPGRARAMRSTRARELLTELMPTLLQALGRSSQPDEAFARFDAFLHALPAGVQIFSLLYSNPRPARSDRRDHGRRAAPGRPSQPQSRPAGCRAEHRLFRGQPPRRDELDRRSSTASWPWPAICRISSISPGAGPATASSRSASMILRGTTDADRAAGPLSDVAETVIAALQPRVEAEFVHQHGRLPGRGLVTVALGKLGSRELTIGSDIDLIFIYDAPAELEGQGWDTLHSDGPQAAGPDPLLCAAGAAHDRRHHRAHRRGQALRGRYAAAALGQFRADRLQPRGLPPLSGKPMPGPGSIWR